ncbi:MAG: glycosyltransferase [Bacillota bacterium]
MSRPELVAMMPVHNEASRYLGQVLESLEAYVDRIVVLDDASTDETPSLCRSYARVVYHRQPERTFPVDESRLRSRLWELTVALEPRWILAIDADEMFEDRAQHELRFLLDRAEFSAVDFRVFDFWDEDHVRVDGGWNPWTKEFRMLVAYNPRFDSCWKPGLLHCGRFPRSYYGPVPAYFSDLRLKHLGWMRPEDRLFKHAFYQERLPDDPHAASILAPPEAVRLERWIPAKPLPF